MGGGTNPPVGLGSRWHTAHRAPSTSTSVGRVGAHDAARILSHCAWIEPFGPVSESMAGVGVRVPFNFVSLRRERHRR